MLKDLESGCVAGHDDVRNSPANRALWALHLLLRQVHDLADAILEQHGASCSCPACDAGAAGPVATLERELRGIGWNAETGAAALGCELIPPDDVADDWLADVLSDAKRERDGADVPNVRGG